MELRPTPYDLVFAEGADERFSSIRAALDAGGHTPTDRDAFLMVGEVVTLIRDLRPDDGVGQGIEQLAGLVHHAYLFWDAQMPVATLPVDQLPAFLAPETMSGNARAPAALYAQVPERRIWVSVVP